MCQVDDILMSNIDIIMSKYSNESENHLKTANLLKCLDLSNGMINSVIYMPKCTERVYSTNQPVLYEDGKFVFISSNREKYLV